MGNKVQKLEKRNKSIDGRTTRYSDNKTIMGDWNRCKISRLVDNLGYNLGFERIKDHENESWEDGKIKMYDLFKANLKWTLKNLSSNKHIKPGRNTRIDRDL